MGNGDGTFNPGWSVSAYLPRALAMVDLDGDGRHELAVARDDNVVAVYSENAAGKYELQNEYDVDVWPSTIIAFDVNADGATDLVVACDGTTDVLINGGDGELSPSRAFAGGKNTFDGFAALATLDFNHDSITDLATLSSSGVLLLRGTEDGRFEEYEVLDVSPHLHDLQTADLNQDGYTDIAATVWTLGLLPPDHGTVYVVLGGATGFAAPAVYDLPNNADDLFVADINNDTRPDLIVTGDPAVAISRGRADGTFTPFDEQLVGSSWGSHALVRDFNADLLADLAVVHSGGGFDVSLGMATGLGFPQTYATGLVPVAIVDADVNDDGRLDMIVVNKGTP